MKNLKTDNEFKFNRQERNSLIEKFMLNLKDNKKFPLTKQEIADAKIAISESNKLGAIENKLKANLVCQTLTTETDCKSIASNLHEELKPKHSLELMLLDQMAASHVEAMNLLSLSRSGEHDTDEVSKIVHLATKLLNVYQKGMQTLHECRRRGKQEILIKHQNVQINGGQAVITDELVNCRSQGTGGDKS